MPNRKKIFAFKRSNLKTFLFFLIFTSCLWLFIQFSKNYTKEVEVSIVYTDLPDDKIMNDQSDQKLKLTLNGNGFRMLNYSLGNSQVVFNVGEAVSTTEDEYHFYVDKESASLKKKMLFKGKILNVQKDTLRLKTDVNLTKKIPIQVRKKIEYTTGYGSDKGPVVKPDSVMISGPEQVVDTIKYVTTKLIESKNLNSDYNADIGLDIESLPSKVSLDREIVEAHIAVSKFTEGNQEVSITLNNVPEGEKITIFPKTVSVVYRVGLDKYKEITQMNFKVVADYKKAIEGSSFLILELVEFPNSIHDVRLKAKQVQYVILKE